MGLLLRIIVILTGASIAWAANSDIIGAGSAQSVRAEIIEAVTQIENAHIIDNIEIESKNGKDIINVTLEDADKWLALPESEKRKLASGIFQIGQQHFGQTTYIRIMKDRFIYAQIWINGGINYTTSSPS